MTGILSSLDPRTLTLTVWTLLALAALTQRVTERFLRGRASGAGPFREDLWLLALWALATPAIVWAARRFPIRGGSAVRHAVLHFVAATAFIVATNVLIRLPLLLPPAEVGPAEIARGTLLALARFYPAALIVYGVILTLGHRSWAVTRARVAGSDAAHVEAPSQAPVADRSEAFASERECSEANGAAAITPDAGPKRVVVREWNRVHLVRPDDIEWIEADDNYVVVHSGGRTYKGRGRIGDLETQLDPSCFVRIHRSAIVRVASIREVQPLGKGDLAILLHDGKVLRATRGRRAALEAALRIPL